MRHRKNKSIKELLILMSLSIALIGAAVLYGYLLKNTVATAAQREIFNKQIETASSAVSDLEARYIKEQNSINIDEAVAMGFVEPKKQTFISRQGQSEVSLLEAKQGL